MAKAPVPGTVKTRLRLPPRQAAISRPPSFATRSRKRALWALAPLWSPVPLPGACPS